MLGLIFRGVFLIGILTWYSTNVWKMIDGYFRDQFRSYLEEEYRKNPRMKTDVEIHSTGKTFPAVTTPRSETAEAPLRKIVEACELDLCPVEGAENDSTEDRRSKWKKQAQEKEEVTGGTSENEAAEGSTDKNAYLETAAESGLESRKPTGNDTADEEPQRESINHDDRDRVEGKKSEVSDERSAGSSIHETPRRISKIVRRFVGSKEPPRQRQSPKKRKKMKTIVLTEEDFAAVRKSKVSDDDFWEFEEDGEEKERQEGILVSELPFKPRADIGDLERVTADEYCPLTLDDEASCGDIFEWP